MFTHNQKTIKRAAVLITQSKDKRLALDLISETYLLLAEKQTSFPIKNEDFIKFFVQRMKSNYVWPNSSFNKLFRTDFEEKSRKNAYEYKRSNGKKTRLVNCRVESFYENPDSEYSLNAIADEEALQNIEIDAEGVNDQTKEIIEISSSLGKTKTLKYIEIIEFKNSLPAHEVILFELYFEQNLSTRDISEMYSDEMHKISHLSTWQMIKIIKEKLNNYKWKS